MLSARKNSAVTGVGHNINKCRYFYGLLRNIRDRIQIKRLSITTRKHQLRIAISSRHFLILGASCPPKYQHNYWNVQTKFYSSSTRPIIHPVRPKMTRGRGPGNQWRRANAGFSMYRPLTLCWTLPNTWNIACEKALVSMGLIGARYSKNRLFGRDFYSNTGVVQRLECSSTSAVLHLRPDLIITQCYGCRREWLNKIKFIAK